MALRPGEYIDEIRFENDTIKFIFTFSPAMIYYYHENMARQYFSPFSILSIFKVDKTPGLFFNLFDISYQPVSEDRLVEAWRDVGRQQQPEQGVGVALRPGEYIDEIRFENDTIKFIFTFSPAMIYYYHENMARQYFSPFSILFFFKVDKTPGLFFNLFDISYQPVSEDRLV